MAIVAFTGLLGAGKTTQMVEMGFRMFRKGYPQVYTTMRSLRFPEAIWLDIEDPLALTYIRQGIVMLDEAQIYADSRSFKNTPKDTLSAFAQLRKNGLELIYTTQVFEKVDKQLRDLTNQVVRSRKLGRLVVQEFYHSMDLESEKPKPYGRHVRKLDTRIWALYGTLEVLGNLREKRKIVPSPYLEKLRRQREAAAAAQGKKQRILTFDELLAVRIHRKDEMTKEATDVMKDLIRKGRTSYLEKNWTAVLRAELRRNAWLRMFGLKPTDVPETCTPDHPWTAGYCPDAVKQGYCEVCKPLSVSVGLPMAVTRS